MSAPRRKVVSAVEQRGHWSERNCWLVTLNCGHITLAYMRRRLNWTNPPQPKTALCYRCARGAQSTLKEHLDPRRDQPEPIADNE